MAIAFDAASGATPAIAASGVTFSHTCTGSERALVVGIGVFGSAVTITGVTYNGVAMTELVDSDGSGGVLARTGLYILINPASGANNVVVTLSGATGEFVTAGAVSATGVNQTGTVGNSWRTPPTPTGNGGGGGASITVTTVSGDFVVDSLANFGANPVAAQTSRVSQNDTSNSYDFAMQSATASGVSTVMSYTGSEWWSLGAVALIPSSGGGATVSSPPLASRFVGSRRKSGERRNS